MGPTDAIEFRRRKRFVVGNSLLSGLFAVGGIEIALFNGDRLGYFIAAFFGVCAVGWACRLLTPPEVIVELPASYFSWIAPSEAGSHGRLCEMQYTEKPTHPLLEPNPAKSGVWDRELDCTL